MPGASDATQWGTALSGQSGQTFEGTLNKSKASGTIGTEGSLAGSGSLQMSTATAAGAYRVSFTYP
jgi:hypothetical protein